MGIIVFNNISMYLSNFVVGLGDGMIIIHCSDNWSTIVIMIVFLTIVIVVDMIFK